MTEFINVSLRRREEDAKRLISQSSPVIIWPCREGILILAANKDRLENRIHEIFDRIACVTLGGFSAGTRLWQHAVYQAGIEGYSLSKGDVHCRIIIKQISSLLSDSFHDFKPGPVFGAEAIFAEVAPERQDDYLAYVNLHGFIETFDKAKIFGQLKTPDQNMRDNNRFNNSRAEKRLSEIWDPDSPIDDVQKSLQNEDSLAGLFQSTRIESVLLERKMVKETKFNSVFKRLNN